MACTVMVYLWPQSKPGSGHSREPITVYIIVAYIIMAYTVMAYTVMAYTFMAYVVMTVE